MSSTQTMKSWALEIKSLENLPRAFQEAFLLFAPKEGEFPYTVYSPPYRSNRLKSSARLMFTWDKNLVVLTKEKSKIEPICFEFQNIDYVENGSVLLTSWIKIEGTGTDGGYHSVMVGFNSVMDGLFLQFIDRIRSEYLVSEKGKKATEAFKFDFLGPQNFKFMNYAKQNLHDGESIDSIIYEPEMNVENFKVFGRAFYKRISPAHLLIITDTELILLSDPESVKLSSYGASWGYIPLDRIRSVEFVFEEAEGYHVLKIHLNGGKEIRSIYREEHKAEVEKISHAG